MLCNIVTHDSIVQEEEEILTNDGNDVEEKCIRIYTEIFSKFFMKLWSTIGNILMEK